MADLILAYPSLSAMAFVAVLLALGNAVAIRKEARLSRLRSRRR